MAPTTDWPAAHRYLADRDIMPAPTATAHDYRFTLTAEDTVPATAAERDPPEKVRIHLHGREPSWLGAVLDELSALLDLKHDWNSYGAVPIEKEAVVAAARLVTFGGQDQLRPTIVPVADGGVQLEWHRAGVSIEVEVGPEGHAAVLVDQSGSITEWLVASEEDRRRLSASLDTLATATA